MIDETPDNAPQAGHWEPDMSQPPVPPGEAAPSEPAFPLGSSPGAGNAPLFTPPGTSVNDYVPTAPEGAQQPPAPAPLEPSPHQPNPYETAVPTTEGGSYPESAPAPDHVQPLSGAPGSTPEAEAVAAAGAAVHERSQPAPTPYAVADQKATTPIAAATETPEQVVAEPAVDRSSAAGPAKGGGGARRALLIGGLAAGLLVVLGLAVLAALFAFGTLSGPSATNTGRNKASGGASGTAGSAVATGTVAPVPPGASASALASAQAPVSESVVTVAVVTNADIYTSRDPFQPLIKEPAPTSSASASTTTSSTSTSATTSSTSTSSASTTASGTLTLVAVVTENGVRKAQLTLDGNTYTLAAGEQVGSSPWQVVEVGSDYAVMLYGDERVTLQVGQGISK